MRQSFTSTRPNAPLLHFPKAFRLRSWLNTYGFIESIEFYTKIISSGRTEEENRLRSRYIGQLNQQESRLESIDKTVTDLQSQKQSKQKQLDKMIESLAQDLTI